MPSERRYVVLFLDDLASGAHWATVGVEAMTPTGRRSRVPDGDAYLTLRLAVDYTAGADQ